MLRQTVLLDTLVWLEHLVGRLVGSYISKKLPTNARVYKKEQNK